MSTVYSLVHKDGRIGKYSRICFGSMSNLGSGMFDETFGRHPNQSTSAFTAEFSAENLSKVLLHASECEWGSEFEGFCKVLNPLIKPALESKIFKDGYFEWNEDTQELTVTLDEGIDISEVMLGLFAIRNLYDYSSVRRSFLRMVNEGIEPKYAVVLASIFSEGMTAMNQPVFYLFGGDAVLATDDCRIQDILCVMRDGLNPERLQGPWGSVSTGYEVTQDEDEECDTRHLTEAFEWDYVVPEDPGFAVYLWSDKLVNRSTTVSGFITKMKEIISHV